MQDLLDRVRSLGTSNLILAKSAIVTNMFCVRSQDAIYSPTDAEKGVCPRLYKVLKLLYDVFVYQVPALSNNPTAAGISSLSCRYAGNGSNNMFP